MNTIDWIKEFAEEHGIDEGKANSFIEKNFGAKTLDDVENLPDDLQTAYDFISEVPEPLRSYLDREFYHGERYKTVYVSDIIERLSEDINELLSDSDKYEDDSILEMNIEQIRALTVEDEDVVYPLGLLKTVAINIIETKIGSVVFDW